MEAQTLLANLSLGLLLGASGQVVRAAAGLRKNAGTSTTALVNPGDTTAVFSWTKFGMSLILGAVAGIIASIILWDKMGSLDKDIVLGILAAGYSGSDFLEGIIKWLPKPPNS